MNAIGAKIKVAIVDDHAILRSGLKMLINAQADMQTVAEAATPEGIPELLSTSHPDVLLLDILLRGNSGLRSIKRVRSTHPETKTLILTMCEDVSLVRSALAEGASGFVLKQTADTELLSAIRAVHNGGVYIDTALNGLLFALHGRKSGMGEVLSERERQVLKLVARGFGNTDVARTMYLSVKTVETYRTRIAEKLGVKTRNELMRYAIATGLLESKDILEDANHG